ATYYSKEEVATLEVQYQYSKVQRACMPDNKDQIELVVLDNSTGETVFPEESGIADEYPEIFSITDGKVHIIKDNMGRRAAVYRYDLTNCDWTVFGVQDYMEYMNSTWLILCLVIVLCIGFSVLTLAGVFLVTAQLTRPIRNLRGALKDITLDDVTITSEYEGNNEIELLQKRFQQVLTALQQSAKQISISQSAEYTARIEALQAQINPHFLYNSLMSISAAGQEGDSLKVQNMCSQLSDIFRYASAGGSLVTLSEELDNVENYLAFMKFRYLDDLNFTVERCEGIDKIKVPKLILQPIIENCFRHGFYMTVPPYHVEITCSINDNHWHLTITDNGGGFSDEKLQEIECLKKKIDDEFTGKNYVQSIDTQNMALLNVYARLKVRYRDDTVFMIENPVEGGAVVHIGGKTDGENS
ncbi:MAG: histidine kinase, partial [Lachnospiraceae bacterium]|nr:histidine kinase [Lachnospiraceae bacterium]